MNLSVQEQKLFDGGVILSADQLIPSKVSIDSDEKAKYSAFVYANINRRVELHFRFFDSELDDCVVCCPVYDKFDEENGEYKADISEFVCQFYVGSKPNETSRFDLHQGGVRAKLSNGEFATAIDDDLFPKGVSLMLAARIIFIELARKVTISRND